MTLIEAMIVFAIIGVFVLLAGFGIKACLSGESVEKAGEEEVRRYAAGLGLKIDKRPDGADAISCGNITNKKGLVGCTVSIGGKTRQLECIGPYSRGHGCRDQKLSIPQGDELQ
jgi:hypothetical protein